MQRDAQHFVERGEERESSTLLVSFSFESLARGKQVRSTCSQMGQGRHHPFLSTFGMFMSGRSVTNLDQKTALKPGTKGLIRVLAAII